MPSVALVGRCTCCASLPALRRVPRQPARLPQPLLLLRPTVSAETVSVAATSLSRSVGLLLGRRRLQKQTAAAGAASAPAVSRRQVSLLPSRWRPQQAAVAVAEAASSPARICSKSAAGGLLRQVMLSSSSPAVRRAGSWVLMAGGAAPSQPPPAATPSAAREASSLVSQVCMSRCVWSAHIKMHARHVPSMAVRVCFRCLSSRLALGLHVCTAAAQASVWRRVAGAHCSAC